MSRQPVVAREISTWSERQRCRADATQRQVDEERIPSTTYSIGNMERGLGQALAWRGFAQLDEVQQGGAGLRAALGIAHRSLSGQPAATRSSMCTLSLLGPVRGRPLVCLRRWWKPYIRNDVACGMRIPIVVGRRRGRLKYFIVKTVIY